MTGGKLVSDRAIRIFRSDKQGNEGSENNRIVNELREIGIIHVFDGGCALKLVNEQKKPRHCHGNQHFNTKEFALQKS